MAQRRLLSLCADRMVAYAWHRHHLDREGSFPASAAGFEALRHYLGPRHQERFYLLVNIADESFLRESIPRLRGKDRAAILQRKVAQHFHATQLGLALEQETSSQGQPRETLLLTGFTHSRHLTPWLHILQSLDIALAGVYSLPLLAPQLLRKLGQSDGPCLLQTLHDRNLRQTFVDNGVLRFSRLIPLHDAPLGPTLIAEANKIYPYLISQHLLPREQRLPVLVLAPAGEAIRAPDDHQERLAFTLLNNDEVARRIGLKGAPTPLSGDTPFLHLLATHPPARQLAGPPLRQAYWRQQRDRALAIGGATVFGASLLFTLQQQLESRQFEHDTAHYQTLAAQAAEHYAALEAQEPSLMREPAAAQQLSDRYRALEKQALGPRELYTRLSQAMEKVPAIQLDAIAWQGQENGPSSAPGTPPRETGESARITGHIDLEGTQSPLAGASLAHFLQALQQDPSLRVSVEQAPVESNLDPRFGNHPGNDAVWHAAPPPHFSLRLTRQVAP